MIHIDQLIDSADQPINDRDWDDLIKSDHCSLIITMETHNLATFCSGESLGSCLEEKGFVGLRVSQ